MSYLGKTLEALKEAGCKVVRVTRILPPVSRQEWESWPAVVRHFVSWKDARQGKIVTLEQTTFSDEYIDALIASFEQGARAPAKVVRQCCRNKRQTAPRQSRQKVY